MLTLSDVRDSSIVDIASECAGAPKFTSLINDACRRLMRRGDFDGTVTPIQVCVKNGCLVFPRYVGHVRKINLCNRPMPIHNLWYQFVDKREWGCGQWRGDLRREAGLSPTGQAAAYSDIYGDGRLVRAYAAVEQDFGKIIRIFGVDNGNQPLKWKNTDNTWSEGIPITLGNPFGTTSEFIRRIDRVVIDPGTQGQIFLYAYDVANDVLEDLAIYEPGETTPSYTRYRIQMPGNPNCGCSETRSVVALVKLKFIPAKFGTDLVLIDNIDALKEMVQSVKLREAGELDDALKFEASAVRELNRGLEDAFPDDTFSAQNEIFGSARGMTNRCF